jgi:hypothetical protein
MTKLDQQSQPKSQPKSQPRHTIFTKLNQQIKGISRQLST